MTYSRIVITCGVSAFNSNNAFRKWTEEKGIFTFPTDSPTPQPAEGTEEESLRLLEASLRKLHDLSDVVSDPKRVSAEYSGLAGLRDRLARKVHLVLIHTDTLGGRAAASILKRAIEAEYNATVDCTQCSMNVNDRAQLRADLGLFMGMVANTLKNGDPSRTAFLPLGGYKIMTSLGSFAGGYFKYPTLYLHEDEQVIHEIPGVPWRLQYGDLCDLAPVMKQVGSACELGKLSQDARHLMDRFAWLFDRCEDTAAVNAFGLFLMQESPELFGAKLLVAEEIDKKFCKDSRREFIRQQLGVLVGQLAAGGEARDLRHEASWNGLSANEPWHLFKGASNGEHVFRAVYRWAGEELTVKNLWTNHDAYEREFQTAWMKDLSRTVEWSLR